MTRFEFRMPDVGEGLAEVEVVAWFVKVGDMVEENQPVAEVETDKAIVSMPAPATGTVIELAAQAGERVKVGSFLLAIDTSEAPAEAAQGQPPGAPLPGDIAVEAAGPVLASPVARKLARDLGIELEAVAGSGPRGRITVEDVERHAAAQPALPQALGQPPGAPLPGAEALAQPPGSPHHEVEAAGPDRIEVAVERIPVRGLRRRIAESLTQTAQTTPHVTGFYEFDALALVAERAYLKPRAEAAGVHLTYLPFLVRACVEALKQHPYLNASYVAGEAPAILLKKSYHIGIATATPEGLVVPVIHNAGQLDLFEIAGQAEQLVAAARARRITPQAMQNGTFTITNVGPAGGWFGTSILRASEAAILGAGKIEERAVVRHGQIVPRPILPLSLTFDHRVLDGDQALAFIETLRHYLEEDPRSLEKKRTTTD